MTKWINQLVVIRARAIFWKKEISASCYQSISFFYLQIRYLFTSVFAVERDRKLVEVNIGLNVPNGSLHSEVWFFRTLTTKVFKSCPSAGSRTAGLISSLTWMNQSAWWHVQSTKSDFLQYGLYISGLSTARGQHAWAPKCRSWRTVTVQMLSVGLVLWGQGPGARSPASTGPSERRSYSGFY